MGSYDERPWLARYDEGQPADITPEHGDALSMFRATVERNPDGDAVRYFDGRITYRELDELTDAFAAGLLDEAVREAAVVGVPDPYRGETVKAFVSLRPGRTATAEELIAFTKDRMAAYQYPRAVEFLDEIPKSVTGKLLRRELRARERTQT